ncbi:hypothetical protein BH23CHL4_BH23CHL4_02260 [soil metagenome]
MLILGGLCLPFAVILNSNEDPSMNCTRWVLSREVLPVTYEECGLVGVRRVLKFGQGGNSRAKVMLLAGPAPGPVWVQQVARNPDALGT